MVGQAGLVQAGRTVVDILHGDQDAGPPGLGGATAVHCEEVRLLPLPPTPKSPENVGLQLLQDREHLLGLGHEILGIGVLPDEADPGAVDKAAEVVEDVVLDQQLLVSGAVVEEAETLVDELEDDHVPAALTAVLISNHSVLMMKLIF